ncbi:MAG: hypothetical protein V1726_08815 [Methanobacteriota archaeon]
MMKRILDVVLLPMESVMVTVHSPWISSCVTAEFSPVELTIIPLCCVHPASRLIQTMKVIPPRR